MIWIRGNINPLCVLPVLIREFSLLYDITNQYIVLFDIIKYSYIHISKILEDKQDIYRFHYLICLSQKQVSISKMRIDTVMNLNIRKHTIFNYSTSFKKFISIKINFIDVTIYVLSFFFSLQEKL